MSGCARAQGSSVVTKIGIVLQKPTIIPDVIGSALTTSSNFFINYVAIQVSFPWVPLQTPSEIDEGDESGRVGVPCDPAILHVTTGTCNEMMVHVLLKLPASHLATMRCGITACEEQSVTRRSMLCRC